jgi:hypothetical protein
MDDLLMEDAWQRIDSFAHRNPKRLIQLIQLVLRARLPWAAAQREQTPILC